MADKKKKINSALSAAGRAASKTSSNVADQLKKKRKSAQQAAQMQESQKKLPSWYGSIDTSKPRVQQRSTTSTAKGRSVFAPQQQTTTQTASPAVSMWPIVPKKASAGLPSLAQVYGAPYRSDLAAYLPSRRGQGTLEPSDVTGVHYVEWMSDMADQKAFDEYRQQMVQSAKPQMKYQQHYNFETDRKRVERLEYQLRFENDPEERQRMQGEIVTILAGAGTDSPEANEYARQYYQEKQDRADRSAARRRDQANAATTIVDQIRSGNYDWSRESDEGEQRLVAGLQAAKESGNQTVISAYERSLEEYRKNPGLYAGNAVSDEEKQATSDRYLKRSDMLSDLTQEAISERDAARRGVYQSKANQYYLDMDRRFGFTAASQQPDFKEQSKAPKKEFTYPKAITVNGNPMLINQPFEDDYHWDYMTDEEKATAIYLFNTKGDGTAKAYIFDYLGPGIDKVYTQDQQAKIYDDVSSASGLEKALYSGASVLTNAVYAPMSYLNNAGQVVGNLIADKRGVGWTPVNSYSEFSRAARNTRISRQAVADSMGSVGAFFYQTGMSMLDNMILLPTGQTGTLGLMALEAADAQYAEDIDNGVDPETAAISGAIAGGIETLTETVSLEHLFKAPDVESFLRGLGKQAIFEGSEEGASDVLNLIRERALYGETSYGTTEEEHKAWFRQLLLDIAGGAVAGAGMYAGYGGPQYVARRIGETKASGLQVLANDNGAALAQAYTDATGKPANAPRSVFQTGRVLQKTLNQGAKNYNATYAQETGDAAVQYYQDNQQKDQKADKKASDTVYAAIRKVLADKKLTRREQAAMDSIPGVREAVAAYRKGGAMEGTVNREGSAKIKRGIENALLSMDHKLQSAEQDGNVEPKNRASERMQQTAQGVQKAAQERKAAMQMREEDNAQSQVNGQDVELLGMTSVGDKATLNVRNQDGQVQEVNLNDVTYGSDRKATAYAIGADMENTALANSFVATLADNQVPARVAAGMQAAYDYAYGGAPSVESLKGSILTEGLNDAQLSRAFELGQQARQAAVQMAQETKMKQALKQANVEWKGGTVDTSRVDMASLNAEQQRQVNLVQLVAGVTGMNMELFQSKADANGRYHGENGSYNARTNTIRLDVNAGANSAYELSRVTLLRTMSHELTHALQQNSPAQYDALKRAVLDVLTSKSGSSIEEMAARMRERDSSLKDDGAALDEVVAEACENMLRDSDAMEQLIARHPAEAKTFLEKVKQFFTDIVNAIRAAFGGSDTSRSREATALMQQAEEYLDICEKWSKALQDTAEISGRMYTASEDSIDNTAAFTDSAEAIQNQARPPYTDGTKACREFVDGLSSDARSTYDLLYNFYQASRRGKRNLSSQYMYYSDWNTMVAKDASWAETAQRMADSIPEGVRKRMGMNTDGTLNPNSLEEEFRMNRSMGQRIIDALELETIDPVYKIGDREIRLSTGNSANAVGGEAYRRALCAETRKAYANGTLKQVGIGTLSRDRWGSLGFLAVNGKTGASGDFTTLCPQMFYNKGCHYCYRLASLKSGVNNKLVGVNVWYGGEILRIKDKDVDMLNKNGGLRIQSFGDWMPQFSAQLADMLYDADMRGLQIKIITKEPSMIDYVAQLKRQGIGKALYFNLSADYAIERAGSKETADYTTFNAERPYMRDDAGDLWWKRAMTVEEASRYRDKYSWVNTRIVATTVDEFIRGLRDPRVDVVTGYHGNIRSWERIDSTTGEVKVNVEALGDSGMPVFGYDAQTGEWHLEKQGKTKTHQALAAAIEENGLQYEYYAKSCCITGRCATCNGKCGKLARNFYVKNATNRDVESFVYWQENMEYDSDTIADQKVQYSMRDTAYIAPSDGSVKFSLRENVEQTKDLVAVHNLTEENLLDALNLGGLPSPSIAIVKAKNGHSKYGPISIVFDKSSIDPQVKGNRVYGSDAWTPTAPKVEVEANEKAATRLRNKYYELARQVGYDKARPFYPYANELGESLNRNGGEAGIIEKHLDDTEMMNLFLADTGRSMVEDISKETVTRIPEEKVQLYETLISGMGEDVIRELYPVNYESPMATQRRWLENHGEQLERVYLEYASENGIDTQDFAVKRLMPQLVQARNYLANGAERRTTEFDSEATDKAIRSAVNQKEYVAWLHQLFDGAEGRKGIYNGKDIVDSRGNRRSWNQLHYTYTLENIVKAMNAVQSARGQGLWGANATGLQALASPEYKNISEIKADSSRLGAVDEATYAERVQTVDQAIGRIISKISSGSNSLMENDNVATALKSAALTTKTVNAIVKSFAQDGYTIDTQTAKEIQNIYKAASAIPTEYFEAKPQRAVYFDEVKYAVVPDSLNPEVLSRLEALVPDVRTYADGDEAQRLELLNQRQDLQFQMRDDDDGDQGLVGIFDEAPRLEEAHIDQRTWDNMSDRRVHSFMNDYPASRMWLARMASILQSDVTASTAGQRFMNEEGTFMGQKRDTTPLLAEMKDSGYTWQQMSDVFGKMAEVFENGDLEGKVPETAIWKRAELILDRAVTEGYTDMNGIEYRPDAGYMRYKDALPGAKAREIPANAVEDTFEDVDNRLAGGGNAAAQTGGDGERVQLQGDTSYQEKQQSAKSGIALMDGGPSNRELLSSALESAAQTPEELRYVQSYKKQAQKIAEMEGLLAERRAEVQRLQDMKNRTADQEIRMKNLQTSIAETESMIDKRDKGLLKMEAMEPLRNVLDRERANYRETLKQAKKDAAARQREKDAAKLDNTLLATQMHEGREWAAKLHDAENRVAEANQKVEDLKAQSLADRMHESSEWAAKLRKAENQLATAKRQLETARMQRIAERIAEGRKWAEKVRQAKEQADRRAARLREQADQRAARLREQADQRAARLREQADQRVAKIQDKADRRTLRGKIVRRVKALDTMLRTPSNTRHVPDALRGATANILQYFTDESKIFKAEDMQAAANAYAALNTEENGSMAEGMYDPDTYERMVALMEVTKKGHALKSMTLDELMTVDKVLQNLSHIIQNANAVFVNGKRRNLEELVNEEQQTLQEKGRYGSFTLKDNAFVDMLRRGNITAPYFFKHLGGPLGELGTAILNGETAFGVETGRATERFRAIEEKYHRDAWKNKKGDTLTLKNGDGDKIQLTREQAMSVWATWKREHSIADRETHHLDQGGILLQQEKKLFKKTYAQDSAFRINTAEMVEIDKWLTQEQKNYVDEVVSYLSTDIAELGNITSNALHGYSKFGEGYYYPFRTSDEFRPTKIGKDENAMPLKLMGFTKSVRSKSNAPVIVTDFTSTASDHINSMLTYYAFAEAQDNFMRLYNFRMDQNHSIKRSLSGAYGANPGKFIRAFMNDMYGGVGMSMNERDANRFLSAFKKGAVMASLSVAIQQSSSIMRAMALIDPKYFVGKPLKGGFAEAKKYAGTAVIKDMGSFDTSTGRSAVQYITGDGAKTAYGKFSEKVGDVGGWLPEKMDAITWGRMWSAVKRETAARTGLNVNSEELKVQAGKRFDEVMRLTQVYDSTLAKSELMREKNMWAKMVTAFMAEATVTYNMLMDAVIDAKGKRFGAATKSVGSVIAATILNTLLSSVIYAMRDDDDKDATYFERYVKSVVGSLDPIDVTLNLVPMVKDVYEIFRGYDVERTDMSVFNDIYTYSKVLSNPDKSWLDRLKSGVSLAGIITGIPAKNLWRDIEGTVNTFKTVKDTDYRDGAAKMAALQGLSEWAFGPDVSETATIDKLVQAMAKGDQAETAAQMKTLSTFYEGDEKKRKTAIKKAGKEAYIDGGLTDAQALRVLEGIGITGDEADKVLLDWQYAKKTGGKTVSGAGSDYLEGEIDRETALDALARTGAEEEDVETRMRKLDYQKESGISYSGLQDAYTDGRISRAEALRVRTEIGGQKPDEAEKTLLQWDYEKDTGRKWADMQKDYAAGTITDKQAVDYLVKYGDKKSDAASETVAKWKYEKSTGKKWDEMQDDYLDGSLTKAQAMSAMQKYGGKTEAEAYWTVDEWDYREANPDADGYSKFHRVTELAGRGQSISGAVKEIYAHSDYKTAKDCGSAVTSALTSYWKPLYIAATPAQRELMEPIMLAAYRAAYETLGETYYGDKRRLKSIRKWLED